MTTNNTASGITHTTAAVALLAADAKRGPLQVDAEDLVTKANAALLDEPAISVEAHELAVDSTE